MNQSLGHIALVVRDYDEAIAWFTERPKARLHARPSPRLRVFA